MRDRVEATGRCIPARVVAAFDPLPKIVARSRCTSRLRRRALRCDSERPPPCPPSPSTASTATPSSPTLLHAFAREHPAARDDRVDRQEPRGPRHLGGDRHQRRDRPGRATSRRSGSTATSTRPRSPRPPRPVLPAHAGHAVRQATPTSRARSTRARSTSARASTPTAPNGRWPTSRSGSARARGRIRTTRSDIEGLTVEDIDGDGRILPMRIADPNGLWKAHPERAAPDGPPRPDRDRRHLLPRAARGHASTDYDGFTLQGQEATKQGLDLNRNFPASWRQEFEQHGAGPYPTSEPEVRAGRRLHHRAIRTSPAASTFHTWSGVLLRPFDHQPDDEMPAEDLWIYQKIGREGHASSPAIRAISVYHEFRYHPKEVIGGTFDWIYEHLGVFAGSSRSGARCARPASRTTSTSTGSAIIRSRTT